MKKIFGYVVAFIIYTLGIISLVISWLITPFAYILALVYDMTQDNLSIISHKLNKLFNEIKD